MNNLLGILAVANAEDNLYGEADVITSEDVDQSQETTTTADGSAGAPGAEQQPKTVAKPFAPTQLIFLGLIFVMIYMILFRGPKKKQQQHQKMVKSLQKNDKVRTIGGIYATVIDVRDDEIILKIDESNNTKVKVNPGAISQVLSDDKI